MKTKLFIATLAICLSRQVIAATPIDYDKMYDHCLKQSGPINNSVVAGCSGDTITATKKEMNTLYDSVYSKISTSSPEDAKKFKSSQKAWLQYRNTHCDLAGQYIGAPMYGFCPMKLNIERINELRQLDGE